jgi:hypothetical protein
MDINEISLHKKRNFVIHGQEIQVPMARVLDLGDGLYRVEYSPSLDLTRSDPVIYLQRREVSLADVRRRVQQLTRHVGHSPIAAEKDGKATRGRKLEKANNEMLMRVLLESQDRSVREK